MGVAAGDTPPAVLELRLLAPEDIVADEDLNSRDSIGSVADLAKSMLRDGQEQPIRVRLVDGAYHLVFGYRRHRAGLKVNADGMYDVTQWPDGFRLRAEVVECTDAEAFECNVIENSHRKDLNLIEQARSLDRMVTGFGYTQKQAAQAAGVSEATASRRLRLLEAPRGVQKLVSAGKLSAHDVLAVLEEHEEPADREAAFQQLADEAGREGAEGEDSKAKKAKKTKVEDDKKPLTAKKVNQFWQGILDEEVVEGVDTTALRYIAGHVLQFSQQKIGARALRSRLAGMSVPA
jgi:ParB/RepB/Spo0J family partition protein